MQPTHYDTPLLGPDSNLDEHSKQVIQEVYDKEQARALELPTDDPLDPKRRRRVEYTWDEICTQPEAIHETIVKEREAIRETARYFCSRPFDRIFMTGCGDSIASMIAVRYLYEDLFDVPCEPVQALDFTYYYHRPVNERSLVITLSSSGATTRTVEALMIGRASGARTLTLSNTPGSPLMVESDRGLLIHAERKGWPTQSSTSAIAILVQLALDLAAQLGVSPEKVASLQHSFDQIPQLIRKAIEEHNQAIADVANLEAQRKVYLFAGGGPAYACALFGAAKVKECTPDHGIAIPLEEYHHYNSQKAGDPLFLIAPQGPSLPRALDTAKEGKRWGGQVYSLVNGVEHILDSYSDRVFRLPEVEEYFVPLVYSIPVQLFAYHAAIAKFRLAE
jgi:glucosamine--fructose-6-phosphate aminotransferase (isomerizing)